MDLSRKRLDFHLLGGGGMVETDAAPLDADGLRALAERGCQGKPVRASV